MRLFRTRHRYRQRAGNRISLPVILLLCALGAVLITVIVGNILRLFLDEDALRALTSGAETTAEAEPPQHTSPVRDIAAYPYVWGEDTDDVWDFSDVSVDLNTPTGEFGYVSSVTAYFGLPSMREEPFDDAIGDLKAAASYISGIYFPQVWSEESEALRYSATLRDAAVLREFLLAGGNDVLLCNLPFESVPLSELLSYLQTVKQTVGNFSVGVAIPHTYLAREDAWRSLAALLEVCDFCAVDLRYAENNRTAEEWLAFSRYYLVQYDMRLLLDESQSALADAAVGSDMQIASYHSLPSQEEGAGGEESSLPE